MTPSADSGDGSDGSQATRTTLTEDLGLAGVLDMPWVEIALRKAEDIKQTLDSASGAAVSGLSQMLSTSSETLESTKKLVRSEYYAAEEVAIGKIKEGIVLAVSNPTLSCGIATGLGLVFLKRPRQILIRNARRVFLSRESLVSNVEAKIKELEQSVNLVKNDSEKLQKRAALAEREIKAAKDKLLEQGREVQRTLHFANRIERQVNGLKDLINEFPKKELPGTQAEVSKKASELKREKKALNGTLTRIINHGLPL